MTPPSLDIEAATAKLALLADLLDDLRRQGEPTGDDLRTDRDRRHVVERIPTQLVDIAVGDVVWAWLVHAEVFVHQAGHGSPLGWCGWQTVQRVPRPRWASPDVRPPRVRAVGP